MSPGVSRGGAQAHIATGRLKKHNMPLETSLSSPSCGFINHTLQRRTKWGQVRQYGAQETPHSSTKNEALIKPPATASQHLSLSPQLDHTHTGQSGNLYYLPKGVFMGECGVGSVCIKKEK